MIPQDRRQLEIDYELFVISEGRVVDGDPAAGEQALYLESEPIEDQLSAESQEHA